MALWYDKNGNYNYDYDIQNNTDKDLGFNIFEERQNTSNESVVNSFPYLMWPQRYRYRLKYTGLLAFIVWGALLLMHLLPSITMGGRVLRQMCIRDSAIIDKMDLPSGASIQISGSYEDQQDSFSDLGTLAVLIVILVFIVM